VWEVYHVSKSVVDAAAFSIVEKLFRPQISKYGQSITVKNCQSEVFEGARDNRLDSNHYHRLSNIYALFYDASSGTPPVRVTPRISSTSMDVQEDRII